MSMTYWTLCTWVTFCYSSSFITSACFTSFYMRLLSLSVKLFLLKVFLTWSLTSLGREPNLKELLRGLTPSFWTLGLGFIVPKRKFLLKSSSHSWKPKSSSSSNIGFAYWSNIVCAFLRIPNVTSSSPTLMFYFASIVVALCDKC